MKIERGKNENKSLAPLSKNTIHEIHRKSDLTFAQELSQRQTQIEQYKMQELLQEIDKINSRLQKQLTLKDIIMYKRMVSDFLKEATTSAYRLQKDRGWQRRGRSILVSVQTIDSIVENMINDFMKKKSSAMEILATLDKIRGMLVDLMI
jgi:uncharacterized protein YaaR (DUF327 family)